MEIGDRVRFTAAVAGACPVRGDVVAVNEDGYVAVRWNGAIPEGDVSFAHLYPEAHDAGDVVWHPPHHLEPADAAAGDIFIPIADLIAVQPLTELAEALLFEGGDA